MGIYWFGVEIDLDDLPALHEADVHLRDAEFRRFEMDGERLVDLQLRAEALDVETGLLRPPPGTEEGKVGLIVLAERIRVVA